MCLFQFLSLISVVEGARRDGGNNRPHGNDLMYNMCRKFHAGTDRGPSGVYK